MPMHILIVHAHAYIHTCIPAHIHTYIHAWLMDTRICMHHIHVPCTHPQAYACMMHTYIGTYIWLMDKTHTHAPHAYIHKYVYVAYGHDTCIHHIRTYMAYGHNTHACTTCPIAHTHKDAHASCTHTHTHMQTSTYMHTYLHTYKA